MIGANWPLEETIGASRNRANDSFEVVGVDRQGRLNFRYRSSADLWMVKPDLGLHPIAHLIETFLYPPVPASSHPFSKCVDNLPS